MRRTKEWWAQLTAQERSELVFIERNAGFSARSSYLPDDCYECGVCSSPTLWGGLCRTCSRYYQSLLDKATAGIKEKVDVRSHVD